MYRGVPFLKKFCDTMEEDKPTVHAHYYYFIPGERGVEEDRGLSGFIPIPAAVILCLADNKKC